MIIKNILNPFVAAAVAVSALGTSAAAQHLWTLDECLQYAESHSIDIQRRELNVRQRDVQLNTSRYSRLPEISARIGEQVSFGNYNYTTGSMDGSEMRENKDLSYTTGGIGLSLPLFEGLRINNQVKADRFSLEAATADLSLARKNLGIMIARDFFECLYCKCMIDVALEQVKVSSAMAEKAKALVDEGRRPYSELAEAEAKLADDKYTLADVTGQCRLALMTLSQRMNLVDSVDFDIMYIDVEPASPEIPGTIFEDAVDAWPSIVAARARIEQQKALMGVARSGYFPSLSLQGSVGSFYVKFFQNDPWLGGFGDQFFRNNMNEVVGLHLNIPIFSRFKVRNSVRSAAFNIRDMQLSLDEARLQLRKEIQTASTNAYVAYDKYISAQKAADAARISAEYAEDSYEAGRSSIFDFQQAQQKYLKAQQNMLQTKFDYLIRLRILRFYYNNEHYDENI